MRFLLPSRFNIIRDPSEAYTGTNILLPRQGAVRATEQYLQTNISSAQDNRLLTEAMHKIRTSPSSKNNFTTGESQKISTVPKGICHYVYSRLTPMSFHSSVLNETFLYSDYIVYLNACYIANHKSEDKYATWKDKAQEFYNWSRLRELRIDFSTKNMCLYRCNTLWKEVNLERSFDIIVEASSSFNVQERLNSLHSRVDNLSKASSYR